MHIVIIGNGIAGITAAITIRKISEHAVTVIGSESQFFFARTALMYLYLGQLKFEHIKGYEDWFWKENRIQLVFDHANAIDLTKKAIHLTSNSVIPYDKLLLATGSEPNRTDCPGSNLSGVHSFYSLQDLSQIEKATQGCQEAVIVGGGLTGIELAEMLHSRKIKTTMLIRNDWYWANNLPEPEARLIERTLTENAIGFRLKASLASLQGNENDQLKSVLTSTGEELPCTFAGITIGVKPNLQLAKTTTLKTGKGILVNEFLETSYPNVYAAGDCAELTFADNKVEQLWYTGRMQGETAAHNLCGQRISYNRGIPFNSAKFFDLEFQSYGQVKPEINPYSPSFYWQHPEKKISLRINYVEENGNAVCGLVSIGLRLRHEVCESWIKTKTPLLTVIKNLPEAFFDPELATDHYKPIKLAFQDQFPEAEFKPKKKHGFPWF